MEHRLQIVVAILIATAGGVFWFSVVDPARRHAEFCQATKAEFESLAKKRPPTITRRQWQNVVSWTLNAHGNCLQFAQNLPQSERDRFLTQLRQRLQGPVELETVDWIWDEIMRLTPNGRRYSDRWRPTTPKRLQEYKDGDLERGGIEVD